MSADELKPCPFCGFEDVCLDGDEWEHINGEDGYVECFVYCPRCGAHGPHAFRYDRGLDMTQGVAMEAWNRRAK